MDKIYKEHYVLVCKKADCFNEYVDLFMKFNTLDKTRAILESQSKTWIYDLPSMVKLFGSALLVFSQPIIDKILSF